MMLITAITGHLGIAVTRFLLEKMEPAKIIGLTKDPLKAEDLKSKRIEIVNGNYFDYSSLVKNFGNIDKLLFISSGDLNDRVKQHKNVIDAAKEAGVKHIYYTSYVNADVPDPYFTITKDHFKTENYIKSSGITYTIIRDGTYMDELLDMIGDAVNTGKIYFPAGDGKVSFASRNDEAEAIANILTSEGHENKTYDLDSNTGYSLYDAANALSEVLGRKVEYVDIPLEVMQQELKKVQPQFIVDLTTQMAKAIKHNEWNHPDPTLEKLLGRKPTGIKEFFENNLQKK